MCCQLSLSTMISAVYATPADRTINNSCNSIKDKSQSGTLLSKCYCDCWQLGCSHPQGGQLVFLGRYESEMQCLLSRLTWARHIGSRRETTPTVPHSEVHACSRQGQGRRLQICGGTTTHMKSSVDGVSWQFQHSRN